MVLHGVGNKGGNNNAPSVSFYGMLGVYIYIYKLWMAEMFVFESFG